MRKCSFVMLSLLLMCSVSHGADPNLLGHWSFENGLTTDDSGNGFNGVTSGTAPIGTSDVPFQLSLNGLGDTALDMTNNGWIGVGTPAARTAFNLETFTVTCWIKGLPQDGWRPMVSKFGESGRGWQLRRCGGVTNELSWTIRGIGDEDWCTDHDPVADGEWHHVVGIASFNSGTNQTSRELWVDGVQIRTGVNSGQPNSTTAALGLGVRFDEADSSSAEAGNIMDDVRIYGGILSSDTIQRMCPPPAARAGNPEPADGFVGVIDLGSGSLSWTDPTQAVPGTSGVESYDVWIEFPDPNGGWVQVADDLVDTTLPFPGSLKNNESYRWRVDTNLTDANSVYIAAGTLWSFESSADPVITRQPKTIGRLNPIDPGETVQFVVEALDPLGGTLSYQWYVDGLAVIGATDNIFIWNNVKETDHGRSVHVDVSTDSATIQSDTALLLIKNCIAQYSFNDPNGAFGLGKDSRFGGYHCSIIGGSLGTATGPFGDGALDFNDGDPNTLGLVSDIKSDAKEWFRNYGERTWISVSFWMKGWPGSSDTFVGQHNNGSRGWRVKLKGSDRISFQTQDHDRDGEFTSEDHLGVVPETLQNFLDDGQWHHYVAAIGPDADPSAGNGIDRGDKTIYIDGVKVGQLDIDFNRPGIGFDGSGLDAFFAIGVTAKSAGDYSNVVDNGKDIQIDEVRVYNYAIEQDKVNSLFANEPEPCLTLDGDLDHDCTVTIFDFVMLAENFLESTL